MWRQGEAGRGLKEGWARRRAGSRPRKERVGMQVHGMGEGRGREEERIERKPVYCP